MNKIIISMLVSFFAATSLQASTLDDLVKSGNTLWSQGKLLEAETEFNKALEIDPDSSVAHARMANLYLTQNKSEAAGKEFQNAIINDPENPKLFIGLAITYLHLNYHQMAEAMVKHAIELDPDMENAQKLMTYMDAKKDKMNQTKEAHSTTATSMNNPAKVQSPHGVANSSMPAAVKKSLQK